MNIDLVVPYVDSSDKNWQELFNKYNPNAGEQIEEVNAANRFRGQGDFFRFFFRGLAANLPWIRKIHLLVQSKSQVPDWLDVNKVHVVLHKEFIPEEYLPTFNSCTIEMFLWNIPGLAEKFLYLNDDMFIIKQTLKTDFFIDDKVRENFVTTPIGGIFGSHCTNAFKTIYNNDNFIRPDHEAKPYYKSVVKECYFKFEKMIKNSITQFRDAKNYNCYLYSLYQKKKELVIKSDIIFKYLKYYDKNILDKADTVCINDADVNRSIYDNSLLIDYFIKKYPNKSRYELNNNLKFETYDLNNNANSEKENTLNLFVGASTDKYEQKPEKAKNNTNNTLDDYSYFF